MMKTIFTKNEISVGMFIIKNSAKKTLKDLSFATTVTFKIGFSNTDKFKYGMCNILTDGWYCGLANTLDELCEYLNKDEDGFRPLTKDEFTLMLNSTNQGFY